ncbi:MAG: ComF family protein [Gammaproteobacteria bacterium]|nr:ComF family protein [Gammaproteobacteria bacterium]
MRQPRRMPWIDNCVKTLLDSLYPWRCLVCGVTSDQDYGLCAGCERSLPAMDTACPRCGRATTAALRCGACLRDPPVFDQSLAAFRYSVPLSSLIQALKYRHQIGVAPTLGHLLARTLRPRITIMPEAIVPVPLHRRRLRRRGFNQALELARPVALQTGVPIRFALRERDTPPQAELAPQDRRRNVRAAFRPPRHMQVRHVAIVDDVMTTGATANELARALKDGGAKHIQVWVLART